MALRYPSSDPEKLERQLGFLYRLRLEQSFVLTPTIEEQDEALDQLLGSAGYGLVKNEVPHCVYSDYMGTLTGGKVPLRELYTDYKARRKGEAQEEEARREQYRQGGVEAQAKRAEWLRQRRLRIEEEKLDAALRWHAEREERDAAWHQAMRLKEAKDKRFKERQLDDEVRGIRRPIIVVGGRILDAASWYAIRHVEGNLPARLALQLLVNLCHTKGAAFALFTHAVYHAERRVK